MNTQVNMVGNLNPNNFFGKKNIEERVSMVEAKVDALESITMQNSALVNQVVNVLTSKPIVKRNLPRSATLKILNTSDSNVNVIILKSPRTEYRFTADSFGVNVISQLHSAGYTGVKRSDDGNWLLVDPINGLSKGIIHEMGTQKFNDDKSKYRSSCLNECDFQYNYIEKVKK